MGSLALEPSGTEICTRHMVPIGSWHFTASWAPLSAFLFTCLCLFRTIDLRQRFNDWWAYSSLEWIFLTSQKVSLHNLECLLDTCISSTVPIKSNLFTRQGIKIYDLCSSKFLQFFMKRHFQEVKFQTKMWASKLYHEKGKRCPCHSSLVAVVNMNIDWSIWFDWIVLGNGLV
jgi:hypothetical protein